MGQIVNWLTGRIWPAGRLLRTPELKITPSISNKLTEIICDSSHQKESVVSFFITRY